MNLKRIQQKLKSFIPVMKGKAMVAFSQFGEDIILTKMLDRYGVKNITYLDIGANDPVEGSNTYYFYLRGHRGVLVEPNADLCKQLKKVRPADTILNFGISNNTSIEADYYMFGNKHTPLNTFSKEDALNSEKEGIPIQKIIKLPLKNINDVISENFVGAPTLISLDVEGLDEIILRELDFKKHGPLLICVETVSFTLRKELIKKQAILDFLLSNGYFIYADTNVNTIFCSRKILDSLIAKIP